MQCNSAMHICVISSCGGVSPEKKDVMRVRYAILD